jgi:hypothetical protein
MPAAPAFFRNFRIAHSLKAIEPSCGEIGDQPFVPFTVER